MKTPHISKIAVGFMVLAFFFNMSSVHAQNSTETQCMSQTNVEKIIGGPPLMQQLKGYKLQCATKMGSVVYENYLPNSTAPVNEPQEIPSTIQSPLQVLPYSGSFIISEVNTGQSAQVPVTVSIEKGYQIFHASISMENIPPHVQAWIDPRDTGFFKHDPNIPNLANATVYIYVDSGAKAGSYDIPIEANDLSMQEPSGNETELNHAIAGMLHLTVSGNANTWSDVGIPNMQRAMICSHIGSSGTECSGFVSYEEYPITVYGQNQKVTMSVPDLPAGKYLRFIPDEITATPEGTTLKMMTSGIVTPGAPNAIFTPIITIVAQLSDGSQAISYIPIAKTQNLTIINSPQPIEFYGMFGGNGESGHGIFGTIYDPSDNTRNPLPVKLTVLGMQNGSTITPMPSWLSVSIPNSSFNLVPTVPYFFTIDFSSNNAAFGTYPVAIGENVGGSNFVQDVQIKIYQPVRMGPATGIVSLTGPPVGQVYPADTGENSWIPLVGFGGIVGGAATAISLFIIRKK
ncbi:MAG: hypothetical protein ACYDAJ_10355 [Nitrosotalea sp.]